MGYYIDLEKISIDDYRARIESAYLPPSRLILKDKIDERFGYFKGIGIKNVNGLIQILKKKDKFLELSKVDCFSGDYLTILLRELNSTLPKPNKISDFIEIAKNTIDSLGKIGITNTEKLYDKVVKKSDRQKLADSTGIEYQGILKLTKLSDLSRIKWVGVTYAQMLYDLGVDTVEKVSKSDSIDLHSKINQMIKDKNIFKGAIGLNDVKILIESASELPLDIEY
jgi:predicted flap endonuclease-1-like 5' DNA nuclease